RPTLHPISLLFFSTRPRAHRALHSFPTRRSSDLVRQVHAGRDEPAALDQLVMVWVTGRDDPCGKAVRGEEQPLRSTAGERLSERSEEHTSDSSHDQISYAVFCLKKKKK